jgi:hypothetical protein
MSVDFVKEMIDRDFRLDLHGHQHKSQVTPEDIQTPDEAIMTVVSAGSLCAGPKDLPVGTHRQYNVI